MCLLSWRGRARGIKFRQQDGPNSRRTRLGVEAQAKRIIITVRRTAEHRNPHEGGEGLKARDLKEEMLSTHCPAK